MERLETRIILLLVGYLIGTDLGLMEGFPGVSVDVGGGGGVELRALAARVGLGVAEPEPLPDLLVRECGALQLLSYLTNQICCGKL